MLRKMFIFIKDHKDEIISVGILITAFISSVSLYFSVRNNKAVHYVNSITKSRIEWIQHLRDTVAEFISNTNINNNVYYKNCDEKTGVHLSKCQQLCSEIRLLLNSCDKIDKEIIEVAANILEAFRLYCTELNYSKTSLDGQTIDTLKMIQYKKKVEGNIEILCGKVQIYLKAEWNRVKYESQGKIYEKDTQEFDYKELENKYANSSYKNKVWKRFYINSLAKIKRIITSPEFVIVSLILFVSVIIILVIKLLRVLTILSLLYMEAF